MKLPEDDLDATEVDSNLAPKPSPAKSPNSRGGS